MMVLLGDVVGPKCSVSVSNIGGVVGLDDDPAIVAAFPFPFDCCGLRSSSSRRTRTDDENGMREFMR